MAETDLTEPTVIDRDTMLVGLTAIGIRLYADSGEVLADSILAAPPATFASTAPMLHRRRFPRTGS